MLPFLLAGAGLLALLLIVGGIFLVLGLVKSAGASSEFSAIVSREDEDGTAYVPLMNGNSIQIKGDVSLAALTKDRKHLVVLMEDGSLYAVNQRNSEKTEIAHNVDTVNSLRNDGLFFTNKDSKKYRYTFRNDESVLLGTNIANAYSPNNLTTLYSTDDGKIYLLPADRDEGERIGSYTDSIYMEAVSDDGKTAVWTEKTGSEELTTVLYAGGDKTTLGSVSGKYDYTVVSFSDDQKYAVIGSLDGDSIWIAEPGKEEVKVKLGAELGRSTFYSEKGDVQDLKRSEIRSLYVSTESENGYNLYGILADGSRERMLTKINSYVIADGTIIYLTTDNDLYCAKIREDRITDEYRIASEVNLFETPENGKFVYYIKDYDNDDESGVLYCFKIGTKESKRVSSDAGCWISQYLSLGGYLYVSFSETGDTVYYLEEMEEVKDTYANMGTLVAWTYGNESRKKISGEVLANSLNSGRMDGQLNPSSFIFLKYSSKSASGDILCNWMYYNGSKVTKFATDVIR